MRCCSRTASWRQTARSAPAAQINELSKIVYTTCNVCAKDPNPTRHCGKSEPSRRCRTLEHKKIEYTECDPGDVSAIPVAYFPYFWNADPSVKRESGLLPPVFGSSSNIGAFYGQPYYQVIDDQSDATFLPMMTTEAGPQLDVEYRRRFNDGSFLVNASGGYVDQKSLQGSFSPRRPMFNYDDTWRWGFNINRASPRRITCATSTWSRALTGDQNVLTSQAYIEGFGEGSYTPGSIRRCTRD